MLRSRRTTREASLCSSVSRSTRRKMAAPGVHTIFRWSHSLYKSAVGTGQLVGQVLHDNIRMLKLIETLGFKRGASEGDVVEVALDLK